MSSKRGLRRRECGSKRRFETHDKAMGRAISCRRAGDYRMQAYRCRFCGGWHIGHATTHVPGDHPGRRP